MRTTRVGHLCCAALLAATIGVAVRPVAAHASDDPWPGLARDAFNDRHLEDGRGVIAVEMPGRAEDAAIVPVTVTSQLSPTDERRIKSITLVIDQNPAPVAATFHIGPNAGVSSISTRVRVDSYTNVHAVAELTDGRLYVASTYVKASGGCSAPAAKSADGPIIGEMKFRQFAQAETGRSEAQLMVRHPNNSGLQMDQVTRLYTPIFFVRELRIWQGGDLLLAMDGGISISENPSIRFGYVSNGANAFRAEALDTDNHVFTGEWPVETPRM
jgi:sulfur-oxidizing protein SoxY